VGLCLKIDIARCHASSFYRAIAYHTLTHRPEQVFTPVLHIHLQYDSAKQQDMSSIFCSLLSQLVMCTPQLSTLILQLHDKYQGNSPPLREIMDIMQQETSKYSKVLIIVDALDELSVVQDGTEDTFVEYLQSLGPAAHIMITSRNKVPFSLQTGENRSIRIMANANDIQAYIEKRISVGPLSKFMTDSLRTELIETITNKSEGMFLVAQLQMTSLATKLNPRSVRQALMELPPGLKGAYEVTMERIRANGKEAFDIAMQVFKWLVYSKRQLSMLEIQHALAAEHQWSNWEELQENITPVANIVSTCAGLVMEVEMFASKLSDHDALCPSIRFLHASADEYFAKQFRTMHPVPQCQMTEACLHYISQMMSSTGLMIQTRMDHRTLHKNYPLASYAFLYWGRHAYDIQEDFDHALLHSLSQDNNILQLLLKGHQHHFRLNLNSYCPADVSSISYPLVLIYFNLSGLLSSTFDLASLVKEKLEKERTYLMYAAAWGQPLVTASLADAEFPTTLPSESDTDLENL